MTGDTLQAAFPIVAVVAALFADYIFSEPRPHPLRWFGSMADSAERILNRNDSLALGVVATAILVLPVVGAVWVASALLVAHPVLSVVFDASVLWLTIGWQSMKDHADAVLKPLQDGDVEAAKRMVARIVSRDTDGMTSKEVSVATVESVLENANDSVFASLFWFSLAGPAGAVAHRLVNTLDAMWGYRTLRYNRFGRFAARLDDVLGFIPARLTALSYGVVSRRYEAFACWRTQAALHASPNAGVVIAAGAGALGVKLGGTAVYQGAVVDKPPLGSGRIPEPEDIVRAERLGDAALILWVVLFILLQTTLN